MKMEDVKLTNNEIGVRTDGIPRCIRAIDEDLSDKRRRKYVYFVTDEIDYIAESKYASMLEFFKSHSDCVYEDREGGRKFLSVPEEFIEWITTREDE